METKKVITLYRKTANDGKIHKSDENSKTLRIKGPFQRFQVYKNTMLHKYISILKILNLAFSKWMVTLLILWIRELMSSLLWSLYFNPKTLVAQNQGSGGG